jgi:peptidylprolyl isomerase
VLIGLLLFGSPSLGQSIDPPAGTEREVALEALAALRDRLKVMWADMIRFHTADPDDLATQAAMRERWREMSNDSRKLRDEAVRAATTALRADPKGNVDLIQFLLKSIEDDFDRDAYDGLAERAELLIEQPGVGGIKRLHEIAGLSYYATHQYERVRSHLEQSAAEDGKLGPRSMAALALLDDELEVWAEEQALRASERQADDLPRVLLRTTRGDVVLELFENQAPQTVGNFISLVEQGFYRDMPFYMVISGVMAITGDPTGEGGGDPGYRIRDEHKRTDARHSFRGSIGMAKLVETSSGQQPQNPSAQRVIPESAGSQIFFAYQPLRGIDNDHTIFGQVIEGWDAIEALTRVNPTKKDGDRSVMPDRVIEAKVLRKRDHPYVPDIASGKRSN